jgi:myo-inositol 2-dehydrogenase/D-chiro-inositol 1-dehydrogenase
MTGRPAEVGVVGLGVMGRRHARAIDATRAADVGATHGVDHWSDHRDLYRQGLDGVVVATPESAHLDPATHALEHGCDVLVEKPLSSDPDRSRKLADAARRAEGRTLVGFTLRFDARYANVVDRVADGDVGSLLSVRAGRSVVTDEARRMRRTHPLLYQTIHDIDLLRLLVDEPVARVYSEATAERLADVGRTDVILTTLTFADGTIASIETGSVLPEGAPAGNLAYLDVTGTEGSARIETPGQSLTTTSERVRYHDTGLFPTVRGELGGALAREIDHFASVVLDDADPAASVTDARRAEAVARAAIDAIDATDAVAVPRGPGEDTRGSDRND